MEELINLIGLFYYDLHEVIFSLDFIELLFVIVFVNLCLSLIHLIVDIL